MMVMMVVVMVMMMVMVVVVVVMVVMVMMMRMTLMDNAVSVDGDNGVDNDENPLQSLRHGAQI